jgi:hypothetical protein
VFEYVGLRELLPRLRRYSADLADTDFDELEKLLKAE